MWRTQIRLVISVVSAKLRPRQRVLESTRARFVVKPWEMDLNFHLNHAMYVKYFSRAQGSHFQHTQYIGLLYLHGWRNVIATTHIDYLHAIRPFASFSIDTHLAGCDEKYVYCEHFMRTGSLVVATAIQRMVVVDKRGSKITPAVVFSAILDDGASDLPCPSYGDVFRKMTGSQRQVADPHSSQLAAGEIK
jgi:acyl-CoA thioesterase FadM